MIPFRPRNRPASYFAAVALYPIIAIFSGLGLIGKLQLVHRILPLPLPILSTVVIVWILLPLAWLPALRARRLLAPLVLLGVVIASLFIYPKMAQLQKTGRGSDQPDCIIVAAKGIAATEWPYDKAKMWSGDPMSCGPGWVLLQTPATILAGYRWNLLILWLAAFLILRQRLSYKVVAGFFTLLGLAVVTWVAASDGTDFLPFGILVAALFVVLQTPSRLTIGYLMLLTLLVQFRFPMLILPVLLLPSKRLISAVISSVSALLFQLALLAWHPDSFISDGPLHLFYKLTKSHLIASGRGPALAEVCLVFAVMLAAAIVVRKLTASRWIALAYLVGLTLMPAILDLVGKYHEFGSLLSALGIWEGANWLSDCIPLSILFLLSFFGELEFGVNNRKIEEDSTGVHRSEPLSANTVLVHRESHP